MHEDEYRLIQLAQSGSEEACGELYDRHYDAVYRYCYYRIGEVQMAQDLTSEVFVRMVEGLDSFRAQGRPLLAWLYTVARNLITDLYRRRDKPAACSLDENMETNEESVHNPVRATERRMAADCLARALRHLTEDQRAVMHLKFVEGHNNSQVARLLDKSEGAIKSLQHRALGALRRAVQKERCYEV